MAFFKFRQRGQPSPPEPARRARGKEAAASPQETIDGMRRRARHRLVGAAVLVGAAIIGFPLLFDTQPRPVAVNAPITIPDKDKAAPLRVPEPVSAAASLGDDEQVVAAPGAAASPARAAARAASSPTAAPRADAAAEARARADEAARAKAEQAAAERARRDDERARAQAEQPSRREAEAQAKREAEARAKREQDARTKRDAEQRAKREEAARARALLEGRGTAAAAAAATGGDSAKGSRFIVQVGAFADESTVREARQKAERAGVKTYTQVVNTSAGPRTRVRVGPFGSREEAEKAAAALKKAGLGGSILGL